MLNVKLLRKVKKHILARPWRLRMSVFIDHGAPGKFVILTPEWGEPSKVKRPDCGTVGCIAGWACMLGGQKKAEYPRETAIRLLGLPEDVEASYKVFNVPYWPDGLRERYLAATSQRIRAKIVGERIDYLIAGKG